MNPDLVAIQRRVGATPDGVWGPATAAAINKALDRIQPAKPTALADPAAFYALIRKALFGGKLSDNQVAGIETKLAVIGAASWPIAWAAYALATSYWETNKTMQPVREAYYLGDKAEAFRKSLRYYPWYGRGDVQTTWQQNYQRADDELALGGKLMANPDMMLDPKISAQTMVHGMAEGWFTGRKLSDYLPEIGSATLEAFKAARKIINGTDKDTDIAKVAATFQSGLAAGGWA